MTPKDRSNLDFLREHLSDSECELERIIKLFRVAGDLANFPELQMALADCGDVAKLMVSALEHAIETVDHAFEMDQTKANGESNSLSESDIEKLLKLNRSLADITKYLQQLDADLRPRLKAKLAD